MSSNRADSQHERLWAIAGQWDTTGHVIGDTPVPVSGSDVYEVLPGGYFLLHHVDVTVGSQEVRAVEIIGEPSSQEGTVVARSHDSEGNVEVMELSSTTRASSAHARQGLRGEHT